MKWITSTDLKQWSDTRDCQEMLPELIRKLIRASSSSIQKLRFPSGDSIYLSGWDGVIDSKENIFTIESGISLWELGSSQDVKKKAEEDYSKRLNNPLGYTPTESIFVFVTSRIWDGAEEWVNEKKSLHQWRNVVVITAIELEDWLSLCPSASLWLAEKLCKAPSVGIKTIDSFWRKWPVGKDISLNTDILLGGREKEVSEVINKIQQPSVCIIRSMSQEESLAFIVACVLHSPNSDSLQDRCIIVNSDNILDQLIEKYENLILIANVEHKSHMYATKRGHSILYASSVAEVTNSGSIIDLPQIERDAFIKSLQDSGLSREYANQLSKETVRSITILRRKLEFDLTVPEWAKAENIRDLIPAILVGKWLENNDSDKEIISIIANEPYDSYVVKLKRWLNSNDSPLINVDDVWRIVSPYEAFSYAALHIASVDFERYEKAFVLICNDLDSDAIAKKNTTSLQFWKEKRKYSSWLKEGVLQSTILISILSESIQLSTPQRGSIWVDKLINNVLKGSSIEWWLSYKHIIAQIAEASPNSFVKFIQDDLKKEQSIVKELFIVNDNVDTLFGIRANYISILSALESLVWQKNFLLPVSLILAELSSIKNDSNLGNKPINTLSNIYSVWLPQTFADVTERNSALATVVSKYPDQGFGLCVKLLDNIGSTVVFSSPSMRWRLFGQYRDNKILNADVKLAIDSTVKLLIKSTPLSQVQICKMIKLSSQLAIGDTNRQIILNYLEEHYVGYIGSIEISDKLRSTIYHHKSFPDTEWSLSENEIIKYEHLMALIEPKDIMQKYLWMFKDSHLETLELDRHDADYNKRWNKTIEIRGRVLSEIYSNYGIDGICEFVNNVASPDSVGESFAYISKEKDFGHIFIAAKKEDVPVNFAKEFFTRIAVVNGLDAFLNSLEKFKNLYMDYIYFPLSSVYASKEIWEYVDLLPESVQCQYWSNARIWNCKDFNEAQYIIPKLNNHGRFNESFNAISQFLDSLPSGLIISTILLFIQSPGGYVTQYMSSQLAKIISNLDKREDIEIKDIIQIEMLFYNLLKQHGCESDIRLINELLTNSESMMDLIKLVYMSSDEEENAKKTKELEQNLNSHLQVELGFSILWDLRRTPFVDMTSYDIDEESLTNYIDQLRILGEKSHRISIVDITIGELLANYPESDSYPPGIICSIIERLNNEDVNSGFSIRVSNKQGVTIRSALSGGAIETAESLKYKKYADSVRFAYPVIADIFDDLSQDYKNRAIKDDNRTKIESMEY